MWQNIAIINCTNRNFKVYYFTPVLILAKCKILHRLYLGKMHWILGGFVPQQICHSTPYLGRYSLQRDFRPEIPDFMRLSRETLAAAWPPSLWRLKRQCFYDLSTRAMKIDGGKPQRK